MSVQLFSRYQGDAPCRKASVVRLLSRQEWSMVLIASLALGDQMVACLYTADIMMYWSKSDLLPYH